MRACVCVRTRVRVHVCHRFYLNNLVFTLCSQIENRKAFSVNNILYAIGQMKQSQPQLARNPGIPESTLRGWK